MDGKIEAAAELQRFGESPSWADCLAFGESALEAGFCDVENVFAAALIYQHCCSQGLSLMDFRRLEYAKSPMFVDPVPESVAADAAAGVAQQVQPVAAAPQMSSAPSMQPEPVVSDAVSALDMPAAPAVDVASPEQFEQLLQLSRRVWNNASDDQLKAMFAKDQKVATFEQISADGVAAMILQLQSRLGSQPAV